MRFRTFLHSTWRPAERLSDGLPSTNCVLILTLMNPLHTLFQDSCAGFIMDHIFPIRYRVKRIEKVLVDTPQRRSINRYLVKKRLEPRKGYTDPSAESTPPSGVHAPRLPETGDYNLCTDYDAVKIFNKVLRSQTRGRLT